jgi:peroxiredoxin
LAELDRLGYDVVGASTDDIATLTRFQKENQAPQRFVSDPNGAITNAYGIGLKFGKKTYAGRVTFVIGTNGKVLFKVDDEVPQSNVIKTVNWVKKHPFKKNNE